MVKKPKAAKAASTEASKTIPAKVGPKLAPKQVPGKCVRLTASLPKTKGAPSENSKRFRLIEMLHRKEGATIKQLMNITGWQQHSIRGFLSGTVKKKLGLKVISDKNKDGVRAYRIKVV